MDDTGAGTTDSAAEQEASLVWEIVEIDENTGYGEGSLVEGVWFTAGTLPSVTALDGIHLVFSVVASVSADQSSGAAEVAVSGLAGTAWLTPDRLVLTLMYGEVLGVSLSPRRWMLVELVPGHDTRTESLVSDDDGNRRLAVHGAGFELVVSPEQSVNPATLSRSRFTDANFAQLTDQLTF